MRQERANDRLGGFALDQRQAERCIGMRPAYQHRQIETVAPPLNAGREETKKPPRLSSRPDQNRAGIGAEDRRSRQRKSRLVKHIRLERARGKLAPLRRDGLEPGQRAPFDREGIGDVAVRERGAQGAAPLLVPALLAA